MPAKTYSSLHKKYSTLFSRFELISILATIFTSLFFTNYIIAAELCQDSNSTFILFHTSDIHGHITPQPDPTSNETPKPLIGGFAALATFLRNAKLEAYRRGALPLYFDAGDFFQGTAIVDYTKGECMIDMFNHLKVAAVGLGNHDFDYGLARLKECLKKARFHVINCNVFETATGRLLEGVRPYILIPWKGRILGVTSVVTPETPEISMPENVTGLEFKDPAPILNKLIPVMRRRGADFIVLLSHLGIDDDRRLVNSISGIDLVLGAHSHTFMATPEWCGKQSVPVFHAGCDARAVTFSEINLASANIKNLNFHSIGLYLKDYPEDPQTQQLVASYMAPIDQLMKEVLGQSQIDLVRGVVGGDSPEGSYIADAMRMIAKTDFAFMNLGGVRCPILCGPITTEHIFNLQPFPNTVVTLKMTGAQIRKLIEDFLSVEWYPIGQSEKEYAIQNFKVEPEGLTREFIASFGYLVPSGLQVVFDPLRPSMDRVISMTTDDGKSIDGNREYTVAINSYIAAGGDGFKWLRDLPSRFDTKILSRDAVIQRIRTEKGIHAIPKQRMFNLRQAIHPLPGAVTIASYSPNLNAPPTLPRHDRPSLPNDLSLYNHDQLSNQTKYIYTSDKKLKQNKSVAQNTNTDSINIISNSKALYMSTTDNSY